MNSTNGHAGPRRRVTSGLSTAQRAVIGAHLTERGFSLRKAGDVVCVNSTYVSKVRQLSEADRFRLIRGEIKLSKLVNGHRKPSDDGRIVGKLSQLWLRASARERAEFIKSCGPAWVPEALEVLWTGANETERTDFVRRCGADAVFQAAVDAA
jgi:hypothetical protein